MAKTILCECPRSHRLKPGTKVTVDGIEGKVFTVANMCTRGRNGRDYTRLMYFLIDPDMMDGAGWPGTFHDHRLIAIS